MSNGAFVVLGSIEAVRPVFLIVMGVFLMLFAWRLAKTSDPWTARMLISGALLLGFGYTILMPLYEAGILERFSPKARNHGGAATAMAWQVVKMFVMNGGWLLFGIGAVMHAKVFAPAKSTAISGKTLIHSATHESVA